MKKMVLLLLIASKVCNPVIVKMPGQEELKSMFEINGLSELDGRTQLSQILAGRTEDANKIACTVVTHVNQYAKSLVEKHNDSDPYGAKSLHSTILINKTNRVLEILFQNNPAAAEELQLNRFDRH